MPHSTQVSIESANTFELFSDLDHDQRPISALSRSSIYSDGTVTNDPKRFSDIYGVALTSTPAMARDERSRRLSSQRNSVSTTRRRSTPAPADSFAYGDTYGRSRDGTMGDNGRPRRPSADRNGAFNQSAHDAAKRRTQYFEENFKYKEHALGDGRERVQRQSPVIAELKTNVIIKDEFTLVTDLSYHLAARYTRPDSCIMMKIEHSACIALGGTFEPCYILTINTVPSQMGPSVNRRNAALIQGFMAEILSVPAERGIVKFISIEEDNLALGGDTVSPDKERSDKEAHAVRSATKDATRKSTGPVQRSNQKTNGETSGPGSTRSNGIGEAPRISTPPPTEPSPYELPSLVGAPLERPRTAHGSYTASSAPNGLRMNPISLSDAVLGSSPRESITRPKSFAGQTNTLSSIQDRDRSEPPPIPRNSSDIVSLRKSKPPQRKSKSIPPKEAPLAPRPVSILQDKSRSTTSIPASAHAEQREKNTYLDNVNTLTSSNTTKASEPMANTAKRRSATISATPKLPPPPPDPTETKSIASRLSKRKSFMKMFKRDSVPAWYK